MKKLLVLSATVAALTAGFAAPASADTITLPGGATATLTIPDATLSATGGCINHYGSFSTTTPLDWSLDLTANGPSTWPASDYLYGPGYATQIVSFLLCPSFDSPGVYTASGLLEYGSVWEAGSGQAIISDQFTISRPAPVTPPPPPVPPVPAPLPTADVTGTVSSKGVTNGVKLAFKSKALPAGTVLGNRLTWTVLVDRKIRKTLSQSPSQVRNLKITSPDRSGRHVVKILRNGKAFKSFSYTA